MSEADHHDEPDHVAYLERPFLEGPEALLELKPGALARCTGVARYVQEFMAP